VYYPVDIDMFQPNSYKPFVDCPKILFAGRLEIRKGVLTLLEAIPLVLKQFPNAKFYFVGQDAGIKHVMDRKIMESSCASNIVFTNQVERKDMVKIYQSVDICVFPSLWENFAYVALEAMACGKAIIATRVGGFLEMIDDKVNGLLCNPNDSADLADKINYALANKDILEDLGVNARKKIVKEYSPGYRAEKMITIYEQIL
ncbi:MAG: glycosyltransferase family 4 protein, partial [Elusimicrobiota bacterium]